MFVDSRLSELEDRRYGYINKSILEEILLIVLICNAVTGSILNSTLDKRKILD